VLFRDPPGLGAALSDVEADSALRADPQ
jgi:hypothetical protein